jgi:hypothetical protein
MVDALMMLALGLLPAMGAQTRCVPVAFGDENLLARETWSGGRATFRAGANTRCRTEPAGRSTHVALLACQLPVLKPSSSSSVSQPT